MLGRYSPGTKYQLWGRTVNHRPHSKVALLGSGKNIAEVVQNIVPARTPNGFLTTKYCQTHVLQKRHIWLQAVHVYTPSRFILTFHKLELFFSSQKIHHSTSEQMNCKIILSSSKRKQEPDHQHGSRRQTWILRRRKKEPTDLL